MIPLFKPYMPLDLADLNEILYSGQLGYGYWGRKFESELAKFIGVDLILTTNSYNSAFLVLLSTFNLKPGDEIVASPMSCLASSQPFITRGLKVKWVDIDPTTGTIDPVALKNVLTKKTKAIFHNHYCGIPGHIDEVNEIAKEHEILIIDDAIEAFGSEYKGKIIGNTGADATIYSFQTVRLPNMLEGGAIIFNSKELYEKAILIRDYGIDRKTFRDTKGEIDNCSDIKLEGYGALPSEINSYIGLKQMENLPFLLSQQRNNGLKWKEYINIFYPLINSLAFRNHINPNFWVYPVLTSNKQTIMEEFRRRGYYTSSVHTNIKNYSIFGKSAELKGVEDFSARYFALPSGWWLTL